METEDEKEWRHTSPTTAFNETSACMGAIGSLLGPGWTIGCCRFSRRACLTFLLLSESSEAVLWPSRRLFNSFSSREAWMFRAFSLYSQTPGFRFSRQHASHGKPPPHLNRYQHSPTSNMTERLTAVLDNLQGVQAPCRLFTGRTRGGGASAVGLCSITWFISIPKLSKH